ncbi:hypothetical protein Cni_G01837 [Canna indica]|uniref:Endonuclease/exonuclease/phosphatase domain-containing protein n=1 Tax=Canna indica TaxID=4628 RepID=A0AAQ3Q1K9_9LILI|nr:hypothetical protein Cni_G01837 [Canna indica]
MERLLKVKADRGIMLLWRKEKVKVSLVFKDEQSVNAVVELSNSKYCLISAIYASTDIKRRGYLWKRLSELELSNIPWLIAGDMNCIVKASEKRGGRPFQLKKSNWDFIEFMNKAGLQDASYVGPRFTWSNKRQGDKRIMARLDRVLYNIKWVEWNFNIRVEHMQMMDSDHRSMLVSCDNKKRARGARKSFVFEHFLLE